MHLDLRLSLHQRFDPYDQPQRDAINVGVEKTSTHHVFGEGTEEELRGTFTRPQIEPVLYSLLGQFNDFLDRDGEMPRLLRLA